MLHCFVRAIKLMIFCMFSMSISYSQTLDKSFNTMPKDESLELNIKTVESKNMYDLRSAIVQDFSNSSSNPKPQVTQPVNYLSNKDMQMIGAASIVVGLLIAVSGDKKNSTLGDILMVGGLIVYTAFGGL